jgi:hypothetical protein
LRRAWFSFFARIDPARPAEVAPSAGGREPEEHRRGGGVSWIVQVDPEIARLPTLAEVLRWARSGSPPREVAAVVVQDEYTHDVVLSWRDGLYLVFDTT